MVEVVAGTDNLALTHAEHEDAGLSERLSGVGDGALVLEFGDDDLWIGGLVDGDVRHPTVQPVTVVGWPEVLAKFVAATERRAAERVKRVHDVGAFRIEAGSSSQRPSATPFTSARKTSRGLRVRSMEFSW